MIYACKGNVSAEHLQSQKVGIFKTRLYGIFYTAKYTYKSAQALQQKENKRSYENKKLAHGQSYASM